MRSLMRQIEHNLRVPGQSPRSLVDTRFPPCNKHPWGFVRSIDLNQWDADRFELLFHDEFSQNYGQIRLLSALCPVRRKKFVISETKR